MARFDFVATKDYFASVSGGGITFDTSTKNNFPRALVIFYKEFEKRAEDVLRINGAGLCHEMAKHSMPTRANTALTANNALQIYEKENKALANVAYKPWENRSPEFWLMSGYQNVADYVMNKGNHFKDPIHQRLASIGKWTLLTTLMQNKGFTTPDDAPRAKFVQDDARLRDFIWWKSQYKKNPRTHNYYVKNKSSIQRIANEKSLYNYASIVINGWLKAAKGLGKTLPSGVSPTTWPYKALGWGSGSVKRVERGHMNMKIENKFADMNSIFHGSVQQAVFKRGIARMDADTKKMFKDLPSFWNSIKV